VTIANARVESDDEQYRAIFDAASEGLVINDAETGLVVAANPAFCRMHGYECMVGLDPRTFIHPASHHLFADYLQTVREGREFRCQAQDVRRDGTVFDIEVIGRAFTFRGRPALLAVLRDISAHVRELEQRISQQEALYRADANLLRSLRLDDILQALADVGAEVMQAAKCSVIIWNESGDEIQVPAAHGFASEILAEKLPVDEARFLSTTFLEGPPVFDYTPDQLPAGSRLQTLHRQEGIRATLAAGIRVGGTVFGAFGISFTHQREFSESERRLVIALAQRAALAIENARLYEQAETRLREVEALAAENARLREDAERRAYASEALYQADEQLYHSLRLDEVLEAVLDVAKAILGSDTAGVWAIDTERRSLVAKAFRGTPASFATALSNLAVLDMPLVKESLGSEITIMEDLLNDPRLVGSALRELVEREGIRAALTTPILVGEQVYGIFSLGYRAPHTFTAEEQRLALALAQRAGMAIKNAHLFEQAQQVATLEERQRLARDLHDAVTQTLFSSALIAEVVPELWEIDPSEGRQRLEQLRRLTRGALAEMRSLLVELRPGALTELGLADLLRQLAEATAGRTMLDVDVTIEGERMGGLPADVQVALYRIAQEALNNVVKHAHAERATVLLRYQRHGLLLRVEDQGSGFEPSQVPAGHLGVGIMHERAHGVGARLNLRSAPGRGTRISVEWQAA
jgi:PAS domain S-box-containing protein